MTDAPRSEVDERLEAELLLAFAPLHKRALGTAVGLVAGAAVFLVTAWCLLRGDPPGFVHGLRYLLPVYEVSWTGALAGSLSAAFGAFCAAWFFAFCRNLVIAISVWVARTRVELQQTRDFLDHI